VGQEGFRKNDIGSVIAVEVSHAESRFQPGGAPVSSPEMGDRRRIAATFLREHDGERVGGQEHQQIVPTVAVEVTESPEAPSER
jgi:hypothetical protein